jgi:hypothetical protein
MCKDSTGCSNRSSLTLAHPTRAKTRPFRSKVAGEKQPEAYPLGYVEDCFDPRTPLGTFFQQPV